MSEKNQYFDFERTEEKAKRKKSFDDLVDEFRKESSGSNNKFDRPKNHRQPLDYRQKSLIVGLFILVLLFFRATVSSPVKPKTIDFQSTADGQLLMQIDQRISSMATTTRQELIPLLDSMKNILSRLSSIDKSSSFYISWNKKYIGYLEKYFNWVEAQKPDLLVDFSSADKNFLPKQNIILGNFLILFDPATNILYQADIFSKDLQKITHSKVISRITKFDEASFLAISQDKKLFLYSLEGRNWKELEVKNGITGNPQDFFIYSDRLYVLSDNLYRYDKTDRGFATAKSWLSEKINLEKITKMASDGSIYLSAQTDILKFNRGKQVNFQMEKISPAINGIKAFFTSEDTDYILVLADHQIVIFDKKGNLLKQISSPLWQTPQAISIMNGQNKIFVVDGQKIWKISF